MFARACACALLLALAGCDAIRQQVPGSLEVRHVQLLNVAGTSMLDLALDCRLSGPMQDALDHGIPITLDIDVRGGEWRQAHAKPKVELRYFPLSRRYQLRIGGRDDERGFATRTYLLAALGALRVPLPDMFVKLPDNAPLRVSAAIDPAALPGALRLPALFEPAWWLASADTTWPAATR